LTIHSPTDAGAAWGPDGTFSGGFVVGCGNEPSTGVSIDGDRATGGSFATI
jgi:hypothetical protein